MRGYRDQMRWELLFADLEAMAEAADRVVFEADVADRVRAERAALHLADRLRAQVDQVLGVRLLGGDRVVGRLTDVGVDWLLLDDGGPALVPLAAVARVEGVSRRAEVNEGMLARRVRLTVVLRGLARDRSVVQVRLMDGVVATGTIDRVAVDHLDLALHPSDAPRRAGAVRGVHVVPVASVALVRAVS
jgi:hypothetical protein